jgi:hypothetical protein
MSPRRKRYCSPETPRRATESSCSCTGAWSRTGPRSRGPAIAASTPARKPSPRSQPSGMPSVTGDASLPPMGTMNGVGWSAQSNPISSRSRTANRSGLRALGTRGTGRRERRFLCHHRHRGQRAHERNPRPYAGHRGRRGLQLLDGPRSHRPRAAQSFLEAVSFGIPLRAFGMRSHGE